MEAFGKVRDSSSKNKSFQNQVIFEGFVIQSLKKDTFVFDRGYDDNKIFQYFHKNEQ